MSIENRGGKGGSGSGIVITGGRIGGQNTVQKTCGACGRTGGGWSKQVTNGRTAWTHECGAAQ